jgi:hypothetical protein
MITVSEIRNKVERKYYEVLQSSLKGENCFPFVIRSNKSLSKDFGQMHKEIAEVFSASKDRKGFGYSVISQSVKTRQHGIQDIPQSIKFESLTDYLKFLNKEKEYYLMLENYEIIKAEIPKLGQLLILNPKAIISNADIWTDLLKVCQWFIHFFEPNKYYIRELPISVHTKFIEENKTILRFLLDELVPDIISPSEGLFEKRYGLKYDQSLIRFRSLDRNFWYIRHYDDLTVTIEQFGMNHINCRRVFIIENKMNFLTFPKTPLSIAIWGKGFAIESLKVVEWLHNKEIYYWSDLDVQGFQMLSQMRSYFKQTKSLLMDMTVIEKNFDFIVNGTPTNQKLPSQLSTQELEVYNFLKENNLRLEQERITQSDLIITLNPLLC